MIIETVVQLLQTQSAIAGLVGDRVYPLEAPDAATFPLIVVSKGSGVGQYDLDGDAGLEDARVSIDIYGVVYDEVLAIRQAVRRYLSGKAQAAVSGNPCAIQGAFCINDSDMTESATDRAGPKLRRRNLEFRIWNTEI
jgi:hypothetical protein